MATVQLPKGRDLATEYSKTISAQIGLMPSLLAAQQQYAPLQASGQLSNLDTLLFGTQGGDYYTNEYTPAVYKKGGKYTYGKIPDGTAGTINYPGLPASTGGGGGGGGGLSMGGSGNQAFGDARLNALGGIPSFDGSARDVADTLLYVGTGGISGIGKSIAAAFGGGKKKSKKLVSQGGYQSVKHTAPAQRGLISIYGEAAPLLGDIQRGEQSRTRTSDIADVMRLGPDAIAAYKKSHPEVADLLDTLYAQSKAGLLAGGKLTGDQIYQSTQGVKAGYANRGIPAGSMPQGLAESLQLFAGGNALQNQRQDRASQVAGQIASTYGDPYQRVLGSSGAGSVAQSQSAVMQALGLGSGQGNFMGQVNPESAYAQDLNNTNFNALVGGALANASSKNALIGAGINAVGSIGGGMLGGMCWVARAVYGEDNPKWLQFREWLYMESPDWFFRLYARHGQRFAAWVKDKPVLKAIIRKWMDSRITHHASRPTHQEVHHGA